MLYSAYTLKQASTQTTSSCNILTTTTASNMNSFINLVCNYLNEGDCSKMRNQNNSEQEPAQSLVNTNSALIFIKPHANTEATRNLVKNQLNKLQSTTGLTIVSECDISGKDIDEKKLIDKHYYAIASKATMLSPIDMPVPTDRFVQEFGERWKDVLAASRACNAMEACKRFQCTPEELNRAWVQAEKVVKFGGGFYCGLVTMPRSGQTLYVFNGFFMSMRAKFVDPDVSIHCYEVEWSANNSSADFSLTWSDFRSRVIGSTDPADAPAGSIRKTILEQWESLGLKSKPDNGDNGVHASASPLEGLAEKCNWLERDIANDAFGRALLDRGMHQKIIEEWVLDPRVQLLGDDGSTEQGSLFDALEDMDAKECLVKLDEVDTLNYPGLSRYYRAD